MWLHVIETTFYSSDGQLTFDQFNVELVDDFTVSLAIDCHCLVKPVLKPVRFRKTMAGGKYD